MEVGRGPVSELIYSSSETSPVSSPIVSGTRLVILFPYTISPVSSRMLPMESGILPDNLFVDMSRCSRAARDPREGGRLPVRWLR